MSGEMIFKCLKCGFEFKPNHTFWNEETMEAEADCPKCFFLAIPIGVDGKIDLKELEEEFQL